MNAACHKTFKAGDGRPQWLGSHWIVCQRFVGSFPNSISNMILPLYPRLGTPTMTVAPPWGRQKSRLCASRQAWRRAPAGSTPVRNWHSSFGLTQLLSRPAYHNLDPLCLRLEQYRLTSAPSSGSLYRRVCAKRVLEDARLSIGCSHADLNLPSSNPVLQYASAWATKLQRIKGPANSLQRPAIQPRPRDGRLQLRVRLRAGSRRVGVLPAVHASVESAPARSATPAL
jgi:hypothetical protein